jgi:DNA topoisomerase-1
LTKKLVIVESPAKSRTVGRFLGSGYVVKPSIGHIRDLPSNRMGVNVEQDFEPRYVIPEKKKEVVRALRAEAKEADEIFLATDPDREGEAISWHLRAALNHAIKKKPVHRVVFHEITKGAIDEAFANAREIDLALVDAQQARRILDRLVGYTLSPLLRRKMSRNHLSAGRVQSVAVRLVVEREREIDAFVPVEYWSIEAELGKQTAKRAKKDIFRADLVQVRGEKFECHAGDLARQLKSDLERSTYAVAEVRKKEQQRNPAPPFITSTLQQEASRKIGFTAKRTMAVAQGLYEGLEVGEEGNVGLITYMRTDSTNIAEVAQQEARRYITEKYGADSYPGTPRVFKGKAKGAQEAHEAIRPTSVFRDPQKIKEYLAPEQFKLYDLIWKRFVASQMAAAVMDTTSVDIRADTIPNNAQPEFLFRATGSVVKFPGFMIVYTEGRDESEAAEAADEEGKKLLPPLANLEPLDLLDLLPEQHFTQPPPRFTEATLIRALEEAGIGRPSTYAPTLSTIQDRGYVERIEGRRLKPTEIGFITNDLLVKHFPEIVDVGFTAGMEAQLDDIASGQRQWVPMMRAFYDPFKGMLDRAEIEMEPVTVPVETTDIVCEKCGALMVIKRGRFGRFLACPAFPKCRNARSITVGTGVPCPECKQGELVEKKTRRKRIFYSCGRFPDCKFAVWNRPVAAPCPNCGGLLTESTKKDGGKYVCHTCGSVLEELPALPAPLEGAALPPVPTELAPS